MTGLKANQAVPPLAERAAAENDDLVVTSGIDRLNDAKFQEFAALVKIFGVHVDIAERIYQHYGAGAMQVVNADPYRIVWEVAAVGFKTADHIGRGLGFPPNAPARLDAGVAYTLWQIITEGHVYSPAPYLITAAAHLLGVDELAISHTLGRLENDQHILVDTLPGQAAPAIYPAPLFQAETGLAAQLLRMIGTAVSRLADFDIAVDADVPHKLSLEQRQAMNMALVSKVSILTGQPGTGKTTALRSLIGRLEACGRSYALACPTGRAAKRLSEVIGRPTQTIHRLLGYSPKIGFTFNAHEKLDVDIVIVDEASMVDLPLMYRLVQAIEPATHLHLVGDVDQLPSVGPGNVLGELIACGRFPVQRLTAIFRQAAHSLIITNAHRINQGQMPVFPKLTLDQKTDFFLFEKSKPESAAKWVVDIVKNRIPQRFGFEPLEDIQVLSPMRRGSAGVDELNRQLQEALNPPEPWKPEWRLGKRILRIGDRVMQMRNDYTKEIVNGDIGRIVDVDPKLRSVTVAFDQGQHLVPFTWPETSDLRHAFAATIHKAQGSEFPVVVIPVLLQQRRMLSRNLLYTAITRAQKLCVLVGARKAIQLAIENANQMERWSGLDVRLRD